MRSHARARAWLLCVWVLACGCGDREAPGGADAAARPDSGLPGRLAVPDGAGAVELVRMPTAPGAPAFVPDTIQVSPGDVVRFVLAGPAPRSVSFDTAGLGPAARSFVVSNGLQHGPLLVRAGQFYDASFRDAPPATYPFLVVPRTSDRGWGAVVVAP